MLHINLSGQQVNMMWLIVSATPHITHWPLAGLWWEAIRTLDGKRSSLLIENSGFEGELCCPNLPEMGNRSSLRELVIHRSDRINIEGPKAHETLSIPGFNGVVPVHQSYQNWVRCPLRTSCLAPNLKKCLILRKLFQNGDPVARTWENVGGNGVFGVQELCQMELSSCYRFQTHFNISEVFIFLEFIIPTPPASRGRHTAG
jgi:hypothetical protein